MNFIKILLILTLLFSGNVWKLTAQNNNENRFSLADTLRGSITPERSWWDVLHYNITVKPDIEHKTIEGITVIRFKTIKKGFILQIDLQKPMQIDSIFGKHISSSDKIHPEIISREGNVYHIGFDQGLMPGIYNLEIHYHGKPREAVKAPWDGGWVWKKDTNGNPWVSVACQGLGASVWFPCKDHQSDKPDNGAELNIIVPDSLYGVGNGRLKKKISLNNRTTQYTWAVQSPINNYCIIPYIGKYVYFGEKYKGEKGNLDLDYWVLSNNAEKAKKQFTEVPRMLKAFEYWFGPYPFYTDGYKLVDAPYLGMEHQSAIAYGNGYKNGYFGSDWSNTGWGLKWDFIIVHESGHEWFANNITSNDLADMWVHEGLTSYSETLFTEFYYGKKAATEYETGIRKNIKNENNVIGVYGVNNDPGTDVYWKASNMIHTIRQVINNDSLFRTILRGLNKTFYHTTVNSKQVEAYISKASHIDFSSVFDQYLRTTDIPVFEYKTAKDKIEYRYTHCIDGFRLPLRINLNGEKWIKPTAQWQSISLNTKDDNHFTVDPNFYINIKKVD